jgi:hypothetical protein
MFCHVRLLQREYSTTLIDLETYGICVGR